MVNGSGGEAGLENDHEDDPSIGVGATAGNDAVVTSSEAEAASSTETGTKQDQQQHQPEPETSLELDVDTENKRPKTTTIGTIALQSGGTRLVIALLESGEYLRLKVLDLQPELTELGSGPDEAKELLHAHDEVLLRLQSKQSPVEELLRQADRVISTQKPKAEVYKAMAETLAAAWKDVNDLLERRKDILERNVLFQCRAEECKEKMKMLETACNDTNLPIDIEEIKNFLKKIHELRKIMLETLMGSLKDGKILLDRLRDIANEGTLDSRPERIKSDATNAIHKVEGWLEELHDKRRRIEVLFTSQKTQLEQCLALALLATDLSELEDMLSARIWSLANRGEHLGDSEANAEQLLQELRKYHIEAKDIQDRALKITKSTEQLVSSGHFAREQAIERAYAILGMAADYINDLDQQESILNRVIEFFQSARSVFTKLDQLEIQLATTDHPPRSAGLTRLHSQSVQTLEEVTAGPLAEGYSLLENTKKEAQDLQGVRRIIEEIEERKKRLMELCTAHTEENVRISSCLGDFIVKYEELSSWLSEIVEAFLMGQQDMGSDLSMARDFYELHAKLLEDLDKRANDIRRLEEEVIPTEMLDILEKSERADVFDKVEALKSSWNMSRSAIEARLQLATMYVDFHRSANELESELDQLESDLKSHSDEMSDEQMRNLENKWTTLQPRYTNLTTTGKRFLEESAKIVDSYLDVARARNCVESIMEKFANREFSVTQNYEHVVTRVTIKKELRIEQEKRLEESAKTIEWITKFREHLYPVLRCESKKPQEILNSIENSRSKVTSALKEAVDDVDSRIKNIDNFALKDDEFNIEIKKKLSEALETLRSSASEYNGLLNDLIFVFEKLSQVEREIEINRKNATSSPALNRESLPEVRVLLEQLDSLSKFASENFKRAKQESERLIVKIQSLEPSDAARKDIEKLNQSFKLVVNDWNDYSSSTKARLQDKLDFSLFGDDLDKINAELKDLGEQLKTISGWLGESLSGAKGASEAFLQFEKTLEILEKRIGEFLKNTESTLGKNLSKIEKELKGLKDKLELLKKLTDETRRRINSSINYYELLEEARDWFKQGSKLLIVVARKSTSVKAPAEAQALLGEIDDFLKPGEEAQDKRIARIRELSTMIFGTDRLPQFTDLVTENREMLDSFAVISSELRSLTENLKNAEEAHRQLRQEREEANAQLKAAQEEVSIAQALAAEAENARKLAEQLTAETLERAVEEARRLTTEKKPDKSVAAQTEQEEEEVDGGKISKTKVEEKFTKEIHIVQKTEIEEQRVLSTIKQEQKPIIEPAEIVKEQTITPRQSSPMSASVKPEFTLPLYDATIQEGEKFTFECILAPGYPRAEVSWYKDGIAIHNNPDYLTKFDEDGRCSLTIEETFAEDSAKFSCKASNDAGTDETVATLKVKETSPEEVLSPPIFTNELKASTALEGSPHQLECKVQGNPLPTIQWSKNDINIDNSPDYVAINNNGDVLLKFERVRLEDEATYTCQASNKIGVANCHANLTVHAAKPKEVLEAPKITLAPTNLTVLTGDKVALVCEATGKPTPTFFWTHDGQPLDDVKTVKIETDEDRGCSRLSLQEAYPKDAGKYEVLVRNPAGETRAECLVAVKVKPLCSDTSDSELPRPTQIAEKPAEPIAAVVVNGSSTPSMEGTKAPKIQLPLKDLVIQEGAGTRLDCIIVGQPEPEVIWYHGDKPVKESADFQLLFQGDRCSLVIHEAFLDDAGVYKVVAINTGGEASSECTLKITPRGPDASESPPKFVKLLTDLLIAEGEEAKFECAVVGEPRPRVIWHLNNEPLLESERIKIRADETGSSVLTISPTRPEDKGNYTAKASNRAGEAKSFAKLVVKVLGDFLPEKKGDVVQMEEKLLAPFFKEKFGSQIVPEGVAIKFECIVVGKPAPKIQWFFNDKPVHGKDFLVSVSGDRQVLTIPEVDVVHAGNISCRAENSAGKAVCDATIEVGGGGGVKAEEGRIVTTIQAPNAEMQASSEKLFTSERTAGEGDTQTMTKTSSSIMESSTTHSSMKKEYITTTSSSTLGSCPVHHHPPSGLCVKKSSQSSNYSSAYNGSAPHVQSKKIEEYERIVQDSPDEIRQEKTIIVTQDSEGIRQKECKHQVQVQKPCRKQIAPRFVSPLTGMIVDQGMDVILEGIIDGFPLPIITWTKNGQEIIPKNGIKISFDHNHVKLEIKDVKVKDAGRYTCTARNDIGNSSSTADLVVKKTIFPPVFGRRLQAQVVKKGDRVIMEVEVTGTPDPEITWYKDDEPLIEPEYHQKRQGNSYYLLIDKAEKEHAGKYMAHAVNAGGEAQSIADFAVFEPTPDTMIEMHKTLVYENLQDKNAKKTCCGQPTEIPGANLTTEQITTTMIQPSAAIKTPYPSTSSSSTIRTIRSETTEGSQKASRTEMISSSVESHRSETKSEQKFHMKLEHKPAPFEVSQQGEKITTTENIYGDKSEVIENENVDTSTMGRKEALSFFESMSRGSENFAKGPKEMIKLTDEDDGTGPGCDVRVDQLTKNYERSTTFEEASHDLPKPDIKAGKKAVQNIFNKFENKNDSSRGIDNTMFDFPYEEYKLAPLTCNRTILEDVTASGSPIHGTLTISKLAAQSESAEAMLKGFNLVPEPPPEIGYAPKPEEVRNKRQDVSMKAKQLQESLEKSPYPTDAPVGGIKIFPTVQPKAQPKTPEKVQTRPPISIPPPFDLGRNEVVEETCIKNNIHDRTDSSKRSWPPQQQNITTTYSDKQDWNIPEQDYRVCSSESKQEVDMKPEYRLTQTTIEKSTSLEKKSFGSKEINITEKKSEQPLTPEKPKPIIYNAETVKVGHSVNTIEEKSVTEKYTAECDVHKTQTMEKKNETIKKQIPRPWPDGSNDLKAPALVRQVSNFSKQSTNIHQQVPNSPILTPGSPPEMGYSAAPTCERFEKVEKSYERSYAPPSTNKYTKSSMYSESESEVDFSNKSNMQSHQCDHTSGFRHVDAPVSYHKCRFTEQVPYPPSSFEVPSPTLTGPSRPVVTPPPSESSSKRLSSHFETDSRQYQKSEEYNTLPKPGSPPIYVQPSRSNEKSFKPESPKFKAKNFQQESGYMADTDEPLRFGQQNKSFSESCSSYSEMKSSFSESKSYNSSQQKNNNYSSCFSQSQSCSSTPKTEMHRSSYVEKIVENSPQPRYASIPAKGSQTQSRFSKGEFRESDYESDYDSSRISSLWKPSSSLQSQSVQNTKSSSSSSIKSFKSSLPSSGMPSTAPPSSFVKNTKESATKRETTKEERPRPKSVILPGSPPEIAYAPPRQSYYEGKSSAPYHNAVGTETKKTVRMDESTENTRRVVKVEQTSRVIKFGDYQNSYRQISQQSPGSQNIFELQKSSGINQTYESQLSSESHKSKRNSCEIPTPKKFVQGQFRESDYESDAEYSRIRAKWAPSESENEEPQYRKVQPPNTRPARSPIITMPSDTETEKSECERQSYRHMETIGGRKFVETNGLKPGSPPEFAYAPRQAFKKSANHVASKHANDMTNSFKSKTEKFSHEIQSDLNKRSRPILKHSMSTDAENAMSEPDDPRAYRNESKVSEYGTKCINPETGLIYFKYDFGYEFGILLPGEGKRAVSSSKQNSQNQRKPGDINVPIIHEYSNGHSKTSKVQNCHTFPRLKSGNKFSSKNVKWEPTSESEYSEVEDLRTKAPGPSSLLIPASSPSPWDPTSPSPASLSPSYYESTPGSPWSNGERVVPVASEVVKPYIEILPKKAPLFIAPLRDIAVVSGQAARFECIVQAEPQPTITWSKDGTFIENSINYELNYRNGVCRLTLPKTTPADAGTYTCTATNGLGSTATSSTLQVPGNRRSVYGIN